MTEEKENQILDLLSSENTFQKGFSLLVQSYQERLYRHIMAMLDHHNDADEVLHLTFIKVYKGLPGFKRESKLFTWIYKIATNETLTFLKNRKKKHFEEFDSKTMTISVEDSLDSDKIQAVLKSAVNSLPEKQKQVFLLRYEEELSYQEIADILGTSIGALKASYHHAVKKIESSIIHHS